MRRIAGGGSLDDVDLAILRAMENNARIPNQDLAGIIGLSPSGTLHRVRRLEQSVILGYFAEYDLGDAYNWLHFLVDVQLTAEGRLKKRAFVEALGKLDCLIELQPMAGPGDYVLKIAGEDASVWPNALVALDPEGSFIAHAYPRLCAGPAKRAGALPQLRHAKTGARTKLR